jgi:hypothetical protein
VVVRVVTSPSPPCLWAFLGSLFGAGRAALGGDPVSGLFVVVLAVLAGTFVTWWKTGSPLSGPLRDTRRMDAESAT